MATLDLTLDTFDEVVTRKGITLVDFSSRWCGPCRRLAPVFEAVSDRHPDVTFATVDIEIEQRLAVLAHITVIPTVLAFRDGVLVLAHTGALSAEDLEKIVQSARDLEIDQRTDAAAGRSDIGRHEEEVPWAT